MKNNSSNADNSTNPNNNTNISSSNTNNFNDHYQKLTNIAETLRNQKEPNIDALIPLVAEATNAYNYCKERILAVKATLEEHLQLQTDK